MSEPMVANERLRVFLTAACNLSCFYCHNEGQPRGSAGYLDSDLAEAIARTISTDKVDKLIFSGGEPLIHPDVLQIVGRMAPLVRRASLITNGLDLTPHLSRELSSRGLHKIRFGLDSLDPRKPRPSAGYLDTDFSAQRVVDDVRAAGMRIDLNVVVTRFNRRELPALLAFAVDNELDIKFFEHLQVKAPGAGSLVNRMQVVPHVAEVDVMAAINETLGTRPDFQAVDEFAPATSAARVAGSEIRYCRFLCTYRRCASPGTRIDSDGYAYTCMSNRGLDRVSGTDPDEVRRALASATARACGTPRTALPGA